MGRMDGKVAFVTREARCITGVAPPVDAGSRLK